MRIFLPLKAMSDTLVEASDRKVAWDGVGQLTFFFGHVPQCDETMPLAASVALLHLSCVDASQAHRRLPGSAGLRPRPASRGKSRLFTSGPVGHLVRRGACHSSSRIRSRSGQRWQYPGGDFAGNGEGERVLRACFGGLVVWRRLAVVIDLLER